MIDILYFSAESSDVSEPIKSQFLQYCSENTGSINPISYDVDVDHEIATQYDVRYTPTFILVKNGEEVRRIVGGLPMVKFKELVTQYEN
jgi:thioredoxin-like negative regulator of GroEL